MSGSYVTLFVQQLGCKLKKILLWKYFNGRNAIHQKGK
jgi:hypothetical protein